MQEQDIVNDSDFGKGTKVTLESIGKLLDIAEESERRISRIQRYEFIMISTLPLVMWCMGSALLIINIPFLFAILLVIFFSTLLSISLFQISRIQKSKRQERVTFNSSLGVVQEILPYYFDKMSVLEKTIFKIRLSRLDIVATEVKQENNNASVQN
jgi:hypothetical protein